MATNETLLGSSLVYLFGRRVIDLVLKPAAYQAGPGGNHFLQKQLTHGNKISDAAALARIYAFAFEGTFFDLAKPTIFLVHGLGEDPNAGLPRDKAGNVEYTTLARAPGAASQTGLGSQIGSLASDMKVWAYDKGDFSMRLDVETGQLEQILLSAETSPDFRGGAFGRSSGGRSSGAMGRSSGVMGRSSGWMGRKFGDSD